MCSKKWPNIVREQERLCRGQQTDPVLDPALSVDSLLRHAMTFTRKKDFY